MVDVVVTETLLVEDVPASEEDVREVVEWGNIVSIGLEVVGLIETRWLRSRRMDKGNCNLAGTMYSSKFEKMKIFYFCKNPDFRNWFWLYKAIGGSFDIRHIL